MLQLDIEDSVQDLSVLDVRKSADHYEPHGKVREHIKEYATKVKKDSNITFKGSQIIVSLLQVHFLFYKLP